MATFAAFVVITLFAAHGASWPAIQLLAMGLLLYQLPGLVTDDPAEKTNLMGILPQTESYLRALIR